MYNYTVNKNQVVSKDKSKGNGKSETSYIFNLINKSNDLCFLYYIILIKYLCNIEDHEYLKYEGRNSFKNYSTHKLAPKINPDQIHLCIPFVPFISYPIVNDSKLNLREDHPMFGKTFLFKGRDPKTVLRAYLKSLKETCDTLNKELDQSNKIDYGQYMREKDELNKQTHCFVCEESFEEIKLKMEIKAQEKQTLKKTGSKYFKQTTVDRHLHHDHKKANNNIIGYACQRCNMQMTEKRRAGIPVIFHNGSHYDWKFLMSEIGSIIEEEMPKVQDLTKKLQLQRIEVLGLNSENYITIKWNNMWFIDSIKFMSDSLSKLVSNLTKEDKDVAKKLYDINGITNQEQIDVLSKKNIFPYTWFDSYDRMSTASLPERKYFKSDEDYEYASNAWRVLECKTFEDYHDKYLLADVVLLAACFHAFRRNIYNMHTTDPAYFLGLPGLSWSIAMKYLPKGKAIELLEKPEHYITFQNSLQGGICQVFQRYAKRRYAEVKPEKEEECISNNEKPKRKSLSQILYLDVNGLYAHIMANCKLPYKIVHNEMYDELKTYGYNEIKELSEDEDYTYFFIVDVSVSELMIERNPALKYLPFFPVKINEKSTKKSEFMKSQCIKHEIQDVDTYKLGTILDKTEKYMVHIKYLKLAMDAGYELNRVHGYFKFTQDFIYKQYIEGNNIIKAEATKSGNKFLRQLAKDLSNIIYGKNIQNILKQRDYEIVYIPDNNTLTRLNYINKINSMKRISDKLIIVEKDKKTKNLNMPIYIGKAILDLTKYLMYDFFYNVVIKNYPNAKLLYMDTDSFIIEVPDTVEGLSKFVLNNKEHFDLSECENKELPLYNHIRQKKEELSKEEFEDYINCGKPGKFKNETKWFSIEEFVALRPKQYSYVTENDVQAMKAKGLSKDSVKKYLTHQMYVDQVLKDEKVFSCKMQNIQSKNFRMYTQYIWKKALMNYENKRYWLDSIYSLPFGHPWIQKIENGSMKIENVISHPRGEDDYTYELNAYKIQEHKKQQNKISNGYISITNLTDDQLDVISSNGKFKSDMETILSNPNALLLFKEYLGSNVVEDKEEEWTEEF